MKDTESYVIRIYRRQGEAFAGLAEEVRTGRSAAFQTQSELCDLLAGRKAFRRRVARRLGPAPSCDPRDGQGRAADTHAQPQGGA